MAFDIYGNNLRPGHCEVHPHVHEEYPCSVCLAENKRYQQRSQTNREEELEYYLEQASARVKELEQECRKLAVNNEKLIDALRPFAAFATTARLPGCVYDDSIIYERNHVKMRVSDVELAQEILKSCNPATAEKE